MERGWGEVAKEESRETRKESTAVAQGRVMVARTLMAVTGPVGSSQVLAGFPTLSQHSRLCWVWCAVCGVRCVVCASPGVGPVPWTRGEPAGASACLSLC